MGTTLMRNAHRHDSRSTNRPPITGPAIIAVVVPAVQMPIARLCAAPRKFDVMSASELGTRKAAAAPCTARATIRNSDVGDAATAIDAMPNPMRPIRSTRTRP